MLNKNPEKTKSVLRLNKNRLSLLGILLVLIVIVILAIIFGGSSSPVATKSKDCGPYRNDRTVTINGNSFKAEAPDNQTAFDKGLGGRPCILPDEAMIFPFTQPGQYVFWMKDMKFPIDMIWINSNHQVVQDFANVQPSSYPTKKFANPKTLPAQFVLEIQANRSKQMRVSLGTIVQF